MNELSKRRENLLDLLKENSVAIIFSGVEKYKSEDATYNFKANNNFFYLTGINQDHSVLLLIKTLNERKAYLFIDEFSELKEKWTGRRLTYDEAGQLANMSNVYSMNSFQSMLELALTNENNQYGNISNVYIDLSNELKIEDGVYTTDFAKELCDNHRHLTLLDVKPLITSLRMVKSEYEINQLKDAISLTNLGLNKLICCLKPGIFEYELADIFEFFGREHGRSGLAFDTIVASGKNATCLHYPTQNCSVKSHDLVLFDLGYSANGYSADISRTYPVDGVFEGVNKEIYESVLAANKAVINAAKPGVSIYDLQQLTKKVLKDECVKRSLLKPEDDIIKVYYHNISHHLGLDTHDVSNREKPLEPGNVITVEPGLYFASYGVGVRIEDNILITEKEAIVLSKDIAKEVADIEKLFRTKGK